MHAAEQAVAEIRVLDHRARRVLERRLLHEAPDRVDVVGVDLLVVDRQSRGVAQQVAHEHAALAVRGEARQVPGDRRGQRELAAVGQQHRRRRRRQHLRHRLEVVERVGRRRLARAREANAERALADDDRRGGRRARRRPGSGRRSRAGATRANASSSASASMPTSPARPSDEHVASGAGGAARARSCARAATSGATARPSAVAPVMRASAPRLMRGPCSSISDSSSSARSIRRGPARKGVAVGVEQERDVGASGLGRRDHAERAPRRPRRTPAAPRGTPPRRRRGGRWCAVRARRPSGCSTRRVGWCSRYGEGNVSSSTRSLQCSVRRSRVVVDARHVVVHEVRPPAARERRRERDRAAVVPPGPVVGALAPGLAEVLEHALEQAHVVHERREVGLERARRARRRLARRRPRASCAAMRARSSSPSSGARSCGVRHRQVGDERAVARIAHLDREVPHVGRALSGRPEVVRVDGLADQARADEPDPQTCPVLAPRDPSLDQRGRTRPLRPAHDRPPPVWSR